jgi:hypothetical protein
MKIAQIGIQSNLPSSYSTENFNNNSGSKIIRRIIDRDTYEPSLLCEVLDEIKFLDFSKKHEIPVQHLYETSENVS